MDLSRSLRDAAAAPRRPVTLIEALARLPEDPDRGFRFVGFGPAERHISWGELRLETGRRAACLAALGFAPGDRLAIALSDGAEFVSSFLGAVRAGVVPAPLPPPPLLNRSFGSYRESVSRVLASARARALLTSEDARAAFQPLSSEEAAGGTPPVLSVETAFRGPASVFEAPPIGPGALCFLQFTSGSTATPRGVMVTHGNLAANLEAFGGPAGFGPKRPEDVIVSWLPLYHDMGLIGIVLGALYHDVPTVILSTSSFGRDPRIWLKTIHRHRGTITYAPNFAYALVTRRLRDADLSGLDLSCLRVAGCGAEPIQAATLRDFAARLEPAGFRSEAFLPSYGMAEATLAVTLHPRGTPPVTDRVDAEALGRGDARPAEEASGRVAEVVSCGPVLPGHELAIRGVSGEILPDRRVGEITVRGPSIASGYWDAEAANAQTWRGGWLHTGDLGYTAAGNLFVCGRVKEVIVVRGANFYPQDIEWALRDLPGVRRGNVAAFGVDGPQGEELALAVEVEGRANGDLRQRIASRVLEAAGLETARIALVPPGTLPRTSSGKMRRSKVKRLFETGDLPEIEPAGASPEETAGAGAGTGTED